MFIIKTFKESKKIARVKNYVLKCNLYIHFFIWQKLLTFCEKNADFGKAQVVCHVIYEPPVRAVIFCFLCAKNNFYFFLLIVSGRSISHNYYPLPGYLYVCIDN